MITAATSARHGAHVRLPLGLCARKAGDPLAGVLLYRIQHYIGIAKVQRHGFRWVANTREFWCEDTGMTLKQYRRVIKILITKGLVVTKVMRFAGQPMTHIRLVEGAQVDGTTGAQVTGPSGAHSSGPLGDHSSTGDLTGDLQEDKPKKAYYAQSATVNIQGKEEDKKIDFKVITIDAETTASDITALAKSGKPINPKALAAQATVKVGQLETLWREQVALAYPGYQVSWTMKRTSQMKTLYAKVGAKTPLILAYAIANWADFVDYTKSYHSVKNPPSHPELWFMLMQVEALLNWYAQETTPKAAPVVFVPVKSISLPPPKATGPVVVAAMPTAVDLDAIYKAAHAA